MIKRGLALGFAVLVALALPCAVLADPPAMIPCSTTTQGPQVCKFGAGSLYGWYGNSTSTQTATVTYYDNNSACSGRSITLPPIGAGMSILLPTPWKFNNGLTVCATAAITATSVDAYVTP